MLIHDMSMKGIMAKLTKIASLAIYYILISRLPNSNYVKISSINRIRVWYLSKILGVMAFDTKSTFQNHVYISNGENLTIGRECQINENVFIQGATIGNYVMIAPNVSILNSRHKTVDTRVPMIRQGDVKYVNPIIEDDVWIGRNAIIMPGIRIAQGTIIGAGAVVTKDTLPCSVYGGVPARFICKRGDPWETDSFT